MLSESEAAELYPLSGRIDGLMSKIVTAVTYGPEAGVEALMEDFAAAVGVFQGLVARGPVDCVDLFGPLPVAAVEGGRPLCPRCHEVVPPLGPPSVVFFHARASAPGMWRRGAEYGDDSLGLVPAHLDCGGLFPAFVEHSSWALEAAARSAGKAL